MAEKKPTEDNSKKINEAFAPINSSDRPAQANFSNTALKKTRKRLNPKRLILLIGFIIVITAAGTVAVNMFNNKEEAGTSNQIQSVLSGEELKDYSSPENGFTVLLPGLPTIKKTTGKSDGQDVPITTYERSIQNGDKTYTFAVFDFSAVQLDETKALEASLNNAIRNTQGAELTSTKLGKYGELNAIEGSYNLTQKDKVYESHIRYVIKGSKMYAMILAGADQATFDTYANSLKLN